MIYLACMTEMHHVRCKDAQLWSDEVQLQGEKETLGFYFTGHPLNRYINELAILPLAALLNCIPASIKQRVSRALLRLYAHGKPNAVTVLAIFTLDDGTTQIEVVCFSECLSKISFAAS